ncbi:hypothetical protein OG242_22335 [Streptomyces sp. NBC_00727]|uniref:hypothetical protein n=1 Tax=Streptomyces sp. NBC_00727 TaxID=2903675 RepID=UPI0038662EDA
MGEPPKRSREAFQGANSNVVGRDLRQEINIHVGTASEAKKALGDTSRAPSRRAVLLGGAALAATAGTLVTVRLTATDDRKPRGPRPLSDLFAFNQRDSDSLTTSSFMKKIDAVMQTPDDKKQYWLFSGSDSIIIQVTDRERNFAELTREPQPLNKWGSLKAAPGEDSPSFEKIDAVMQYPDDDNKYCVFSGESFLRLNVADKWPHMDTRIDENPSPLSDWGSLDKTSPPFEKIDAATRALDSKNEYWVFSGSHFLRLSVGNEPNHDAKVVKKPKSLSDWGGLARYPSFASGIDAIMQMPDNPKEYVVFSGRQYLRTAWTGSTWSVK